MVHVSGDCKMKKANTLFLSSISFLMLSFLAFGTFAYTAKGEIKTVEVQALTTVEQYYSSITDDMSGSTLLNALNTLNNQKRKSTVGYQGFKTAFKLTERTSTTPADKMVGFYDNALVNANWDNQATWNREHVWPNSRGGNLIEGDIHMTRPASVKINSERGNLFYAAQGGYDPGKYVAEYRGVAARIIMYGAIADTSLKLSENTGDASSLHTMGKLSDLLMWNLQYLPTADTTSTALLVEQNRNEVTFSNSSLQGNRNPFIDHPEYACRIWGNTNDKTKQICAGQLPDPITVDDLESITLSEHNKTIKVDETFKLDFSTKPEEVKGLVQYTFTSSDSKIATVDQNGNVKGVGIGEAEITLSTSTNKGNFNDKCTVKVETNKTYEDDMVSIGFDIQEKTIKVGESFKLNVVINPAEIADMVDYSIYSRDENIATVTEDGTVTGIKAGTVQIKVVTTDILYQGVCNLTVESDGSGEDPEKPTPANKGCGGNIMFTSVILSTISLLGVALILLKKNLSK